MLYFNLRLKCLFFLRLSNLTLDQAIYVQGAANHRAVDIEQCECRNIHNGSSCQDPGDGYYRLRPPPPNDISQFEQFIGLVVPCDCNGRSNICDKETGRCINCAKNTGGERCNECAEGFYGNPNFGGCVPCPCPETRKNFAKGCFMIGHEVSCLCKPGYTGLKCEFCSEGHFGNPEFEDGKCEPCNCNKDGSLSADCDRSGICKCQMGVSGDKCDQCDEPKHILQNNRCEICDVCTLDLLNRLDVIRDDGESSFIYVSSIKIDAPWSTLENFTRDLEGLKNASSANQKTHNVIYGWDDVALEKLESKTNNLNEQMKKLLSTKIEKRKLDLVRLMADAAGTLDSILELKNELNGTIQTLKDYGSHVSHISVQNALKEAQGYATKIDKYEYDLQSQKLNLEKAQECLSETKGDVEKIKKESSDQSTRLQEQLDNLDDIKDKIYDVEKHLNVIKNETKNAKELNEINDRKLKHLTREVQKIEQIKLDISKYLNSSINSQSIILLDKINENLEFDDIFNNFKNLEKSLSDKIKSDQIALTKLRPDVTKAEDWAEMLIKRSIQYKNIFQKTQIGAKEALDASNAHKNIVEAINAAKIAANEAAESSRKSYDELKPPGQKSVSEKSEESLEESKQIIKMAENESDEIKGRCFSILNMTMNKIEKP